jgi:hypothetical protein
MLSPEQNPGLEILELVNKARVALQTPPLHKLFRGIPETSQKCVLGRSLGFEILLDDQDCAYGLLLSYLQAIKVAKAWNVPRTYGMWNGWAVRLPEPLNNFVHRFDGRCYPSLESPQRPQNAGVRSELRPLRFDWVDQHARVTTLLERARQACEEAEQTRITIPRRLRLDE